MKTFPGLAAENDTLDTEVCRLEDSFETLDRERKEVVTVTHDVRDSVTNSKKIRANAEALKKQKMERASEVHEKGALATVESARAKAVREELVSVRSELTASRAESVNSRWSANSVAKGASKVEDDVTNALMAVFGEATDGTKRNVAILGWN